MTISVVFSSPIATMPRLSPTKTTSIPAASAACALGKSCAVSMAMGSPFLYKLRNVCNVTFLRVFVPGSGEEYELYRVWEVESGEEKTQG